MSFILRSLSVLAYANGFTLWHYRSGGDALAAVSRSGYFDDATDMMTGGDILLVSAPDGGSVMSVAAEAGTLTAHAAHLIRRAAGPAWPRRGGAISSACRASPASVTSKRWSGRSRAKPSPARRARHGPSFSPAAGPAADQQQPVQGGPAAGLEVGFVPHAPAIGQTAWRGKPGCAARGGMRHNGRMTPALASAVLPAAAPRRPGAGAPPGAPRAAARPGRARARPDDPVLATTVLGPGLANPVGLAAGFDKDAVAAAGLLRLGFGAVELGTVTPRPQPGNPRPRLFRLEHGAVINRMGMNNRGIDAFAARLARLRAPPGTLLAPMSASTRTAPTPSATTRRWSPPWRRTPATWR